MVSSDLHGNLSSVAEDFVLSSGAANVIVGLAVFAVHHLLHDFMQHTVQMCHANAKPGTYDAVTFVSAEFLFSWYWLSVVLINFVSGPDGIMVPHSDANNSLGWGIFWAAILADCHSLFYLHKNDVRDAFRNFLMLHHAAILVALAVVGVVSAFIGLPGNAFLVGVCTIQGSNMFACVEIMWHNRFAPKLAHGIAPRHDVIVSTVLYCGQHLIRWVVVMFSVVQICIELDNVRRDSDEFDSLDLLWRCLLLPTAVAFEWMDIKAHFSTIRRRWRQALDDENERTRNHVKAMQSGLQSVLPTYTKPRGPTGNRRVSVGLFQPDKLDPRDTRGRRGSGTSVDVQKLIAGQLHVRCPQPNCGFEFLYNRVPLSQAAQHDADTAALAAQVLRDVHDKLLGNTLHVQDFTPSHTRHTSCHMCLDGVAGFRTAVHSRNPSYGGAVAGQSLPGITS